jgi:hypothetical protein
LVTGLVAGEDAILSDVTGTVHGLAITPAKGERVARRVLRLIDDGRLDPETVLPALFADLMPALVADALRAHAANARSGTRHHRRFMALRVIVDETTLRNACLDHVLILDEQHLRSVLAEYVAFYNSERPHRSLALEPPLPASRSPVPSGAIRSRPVLGGLHHSYHRAA